MTASGFTADEKKELLELARRTDTRLALLEKEQKDQREKIDEHEEFIDGNGKPGAKQDIRSAQARINMLFAIGAGVWGLVVIVFGVIISNFYETLITIDKVLATKP